jgi:hypothetical protein
MYIILWGLGPLTAAPVAATGGPWGLEQMLYFGISKKSAR